LIKRGDPPDHGLSQERRGRLKRLPHGELRLNPHCQALRSAHRRKCLDEAVRMVSSDTIVAP
jgi:hypothetical protein